MNLHTSARRFRVPALLALVIACSVAAKSGGTDQTCLELVTAVNAALKSGRFEYEARLQHSLLLERTNTRVDGRVVLELADEQRERVDAEISTLVGATAVQRFTRVQVGRDTLVLNHSSRTFERGAGERSDDLLALVMFPRLGFELFTRALSDETGSPLVRVALLEDSPTVMVDGVKCWRIHASIPGTTGASDPEVETLWHVGASDLLPRLIQQTRRRGAETESWRLTLQRVKRQSLAPSASPDSVFSLTPPPDYRETLPIPKPLAPPGAAQPPPRKAMLTVLAGSLDAVREQFRAHDEKPRVIGVFAPS
ncbi:MAG: hypothetical protein ACKVX7_10405 [Planctomycetota bacterium]